MRNLFRLNWASLVAFTSLTLGLSGCGVVKDSPTVGVDGWWDVDYAKSACETAAAAAAQRFEGAAPCLQEPSDIAYGVEKDFVSAFQENPACAGISIVNNFHDPEKDAETTTFTKAKWALSFNIALKDGELSPADSQWQIIDNATLHRYADGNLANFYEAASKVCTVVKGAGGKLQ
jgi:hypothetical protein